MVQRNLLREIREDEGLRVTELALLSGISTKTIERIEQGARKVSQITKSKVVKGLNLNPKKSRDYKYPDVFPNDGRKK